jgi:hypothetical protein
MSKLQGPLLGNTLWEALPPSSKGMKNLRIVPVLDAWCSINVTQPSRLDHFVSFVVFCVKPKGSVQRTLTISECAHGRGLAIRGMVILIVALLGTTPPPMRKLGKGFALDILVFSREAAL